MNEALSLNAAGLDFIAAREGFRAEVYRDAAGLETIGYGHRLVEGERFPDDLTREAALALLDQDAVHAEAAVRAHVAIGLSQWQFDALVSFVFNVGGSAFAGSTLLAKLNAGEVAGAADEFRRWDKIHVAGAAAISPGLAARRGAERDLFLTGNYGTTVSLNA